jgi:hypothetical protein
MTITYGPNAPADTVNGRSPHPEPESTRRIYVASSWRCTGYPTVVEALRAAGHGVYDFRAPTPGRPGFSWNALGFGDPATWTFPKFRDALRHPLAVEGFSRDAEAMQWADVCVLVLPCNRSAHLELGWFAGRGRPTAVLADPCANVGHRFDGAELMYGFVDQLAETVEELVAWLAALTPSDAPVVGQ